MDLISKIGGVNCVKINCPLTAALFMNKLVKQLIEIPININWKKGILSR